MIKSKKGLSVMIGYVLLVTFAIIMSGIVYSWMKTYIPVDPLECPDGVSIILEEATCTEVAPGEFSLSVNFRNNGRFDIDGYMIRAGDNEVQQVATKDLSGYTLKGEGKGGLVLYSQGIEAGSSALDVFEWSQTTNNLGEIYLLEIVPIRFQEEDGKTTFVNCGDAKIKEKINC